MNILEIICIECTPCTNFNVFCKIPYKKRERNDIMSLKLSGRLSDTESARLELLRAIDEAGRRRDEALRYFETAGDDVLIVSAIHELESASARYSALLRQAKEAGIRRTFPEAEAMKRARSGEEPV